MLNGVEKAAWLLWKKLQAELRWLPATFLVRVTSATVCWAAFWGGRGMNLHPSRAIPLPLFLHLCCFFYFSRKLFIILGSWQSIILGEVKTLFYEAFTSSARSWHHFIPHTVSIWCIIFTTCFVFMKWLHICKEAQQSNSKWTQTDACLHWEQSTFMTKVLSSHLIHVSELSRHIFCYLTLCYVQGNLCKILLSCLQEVTNLES